ncbi:MAG: head GIN domain-containing protein [bacterium]
MKTFLIACFTVSMILTSCFFSSIICEKGSGKVIKQEIFKSGFTSLNLMNSANLLVTQGNAEKIIIETDENILNFLETEINNGELILSNKLSICPSKLNYYITMKDIKGFKILGAGNIISKTPIKSDDLSLNIQGSGDIKFDSVDLIKLHVKILGSGDVKIKGSTEKFVSEINGSGDIYANGLTCDYARIETNGSGDVRVMVNKELIANINGSSDILYKGNPENVKVKINGSGNVREIEK